MDTGDSDRRRSDDHSPKEEFNTVMVSDSISEAYPVADQSSEEVKKVFCPAEEEFNTVMVSDSIKEEREAYPVADQSSEEVKNAVCPAEEEFNTVMVSDSIKEEREAYPLADQSSEEVKNAVCPAEEECNTVMVSDSIKEEREAYPVANQSSEEVKNAICPAGFTMLVPEPHQPLKRKWRVVSGAASEPGSTMLGPEPHQPLKRKCGVVSGAASEHGTFIGRRPETMNTVDQLLAQPFLGLSLENKLIVKRLGPDRPDLQIQQTTQDRGKQYTRRFANSWYTKADWLTGSKSKNSLFCFPCLLYGGDGPWTKQGVTDLKRLSDKIKKHAHSRIHIENLTRLGMLGHTPIAAHISDAYRQGIKKHNEAVNRNRHILSKIIDCICFCGAFELALRGHDQSESSSNPGIFRGLVDLIASIDTEMKAHLASATVFKGTSKTILNELLECMLEIIRSNIVQQLKNTDFVAIQVDDTTDVATKPQFVLIFRYIDNDSKVVERFYGFTHLRDSSAETIATELLTQLNLIFPEPPQKQKLISQSYDGASVISGIFGGVQKQIRAVYPNAHYVHCYAHRLNLIMQQAVAKISEAQIFFLDVESMATFFSCSPKRIKVLHDIVERRLPKGSVTCWNFHIRAINLIYEYRVDLEKCFDTIEANTDFETKSRREARGFARTLQDREFQFFLYLFHEIMPHVDKLYNKLQKRKIDNSFVRWAINQFVTSMNKVRERIDTLDSRLPKDSTFSNRRKNESSLAQTAKEICDTIIVHAKERFSFTKHLITARLLQSDQFANYGISFPQQALNEAVDFYPMLIKEDLRMELSVLYGMHVYRQATGAISLLSLIQKLNMEKSLIETVALLKILITTPMTTAESELCFSTLNRIKTFLRNTMIEERLNALAMLSIERDFVKQIPDFNVQVIEKFAAIKDRHADFMYKK